MASAPFTFLPLAPTKDFRANGDVIFDLQPGGKICKGNIILEGQITIGAGGAANGVAVSDGSPAHLVKEVVIRANAPSESRYFTGELVRATPRGLLRNAITERTKYMGELSGSVLGGGAPGVYQVYQSIPIWWADPNVGRQYTTALNADPAAYSSIQVIISLGDLTSVYAGSDRVADFTQLRVRWTDERKAIQGDTLCLFMEEHSTLIPAAKNDFTDLALKRDGLYLSILMMTEAAIPGANGFGSLSDAILNKIRLNGNGISWDNIEANDIRQKMFDDGWYDVSQNAVGQYFIDLSEGNMFKPIPASGLSLILDVKNPSGANADAIRIFSRRYFPPAGYDPSNVMLEYRK
jgi:hypothetical protein